ncbi:hypothetical protein HGRIS_007858 [Hohenbuehelia grisea]|uniref:Hyaluronan/mRNA-binding protein domain-containing protein n=1 Tax=Hohenbuehelia grisea TaxID=104357 RepID=A0ABR3J6J2_9AGAR
MSVATRNPFALLDAEDASRPSTPPAAKAAPPAPPVPVRNQQKTRGGPASRGGKYYPRGGASKGAPRDGNPNQNGIDEPLPEGQKRFEGSEGRGRGRGRGRGAPRGGRRPFDKHSATGKTDSDKKIHQSWGGDDGKTELKTEEAANTDAAAEGTWGGDAAPGDWAAPAEGTQDWASGAAPADASGDKPAEGERRRKEREPEEEDNTLTLEQYLAQKKDELNVPKLETRKANEGADGDLWKGAVALQKGAEEDAYFVGKNKTSSSKARTSKPEKVYLEIDARFERPDRGGRGRGRGDRGGDRARGRGAPRGAPRGGRGPAAEQAVNVNDESAFPSLA